MWHELATDFAFTDGLRLYRAWWTCGNRREAKVRTWSPSFVDINADVPGIEFTNRNPRLTPSTLTVVSKLSVVVASGPIIVV